MLDQKQGGWALPDLFYVMRYGSKSFFWFHFLMNCLMFPSERNLRFLTKPLYVLCYIFITCNHNHYHFLTRLSHLHWPYFHIIVYLSQFMLLTPQKKFFACQIYIFIVTQIMLDIISSKAQSLALVPGRFSIKCMEFFLFFFLFCMK